MTVKKIAIIDLECTCDQKKDGVELIPRHEMEIIEIGCAIIDERGNVYDQFTTFVKPQIHTILTDFCKTLTHITQDDVDQAKTLFDGLSELDLFLKKNHATSVCSWGWFDKNKIKSETELKKIDLTQFYLHELPHSNLSLIVKEFRGVKHKRGVGKTLRALGMKFEGEQHRAIFDVLNMAKIVNKINRDQILIRLD